jgi:hypothetical protein
VCYFPYRYGQALWAYLDERFGETIVRRVLKSTASGGAVGRIVAETGVEATALSNDWHASIRGDYRSVRPRNASRPVVSRAAGGGRLNVGASLSPDGSEVVFLSERDQYSIDVYLADASTGAIKRRLVETAADPHYESLQFIGSAGSWNRAGDRFALATIHQGQPMLTILDMPSGRALREILLPALDEVLNPSWAPDGHRIVFSALAGGVSDLYVFNLESGELRPLTSDAYAELQQPYVSGGLGALTLRADAIDGDGNENGTLDDFQPDSTRFGGNVGAGLMSYMGNFGVRGDVRYFRGFENEDVDADAPLGSAIGNAVLSDLSFWCANVGLAFRW